MKPTEITIATVVIILVGIRPIKACLGGYECSTKQWNNPGPQVCHVTEIDFRHTKENCCVEGNNACFKLYGYFGMYLLLHQIHYLPWLELTAELFWEIFSNRT